MKKALKIVIPLLIILALIITAYWFFFHFRKDMTASALVRLADRQESSGHYSAAIRYYSWASRLVPQNADVALHLAEAYRQTGNYTKTEYTLVSAIRENSEDVRLYTMLSKVYVEQDKLRDAQMMLDNVENQAARQQLENLRPAAPSVSPSGGDYSDYISVSLEPVAGAVCYLSVDGTFPNRSDAPYTEPVQLTGGETRVYAIAVGADGLVSRVTNVGYTVAGVIEDVTFHDEVLKSFVQELLHRGDRTIRTNDLWGITELILPDGIADTQDLALFTGVTQLKAWDMPMMDYSFLRSMHSLRYLELNGCLLTTQDVENIAACQNLETLILIDCGLSNVSALSSLSGLRILDLGDNSIENIEMISSMSSLEELYLGHNAVTSLPSLQALDKLKNLDLSYNSLTSVSAVSACTSIQRLNLSYNNLSSVTPVGALTSLLYFDGSHNEVEDVSSLASCRNLQTFYMQKNKLTSIDFLNENSSIRDVNVDENDIELVPQFPDDCLLETFSAAHNFLTDLSGLAGLQHLTFVNADYNNISDISVLKSCPVLAKVNVYKTNVTDGGVLAEKGVEVNFKPSFS